MNNPPDLVSSSCDFYLCDVQKIYEEKIYTLERQYKLELDTMRADKELLLCQIVELKNKLCELETNCQCSKKNVNANELTFDSQSIIKNQIMSLDENMLELTSKTSQNTITNYMHSNYQEQLRLVQNQHQNEVKTFLDKLDLTVQQATSELYTIIRNLQKENDKSIVDYCASNSVGEMIKQILNTYLTNSWHSIQALRKLHQTEICEALHLYETHIRSILNHTPLVAMENDKQIRASDLQLKEDLEKPKICLERHIDHLNKTQTIEKEKLLNEIYDMIVKHKTDIEWLVPNTVNSTSSDQRIDDHFTDDKVNLNQKKISYFEEQLEHLDVKLVSIIHTLYVKYKENLQDLNDSFCLKMKYLEDEHETCLQKQEEKYRTELENLKTKFKCEMKKSNHLNLSTEAFYGACCR
ncbi:unnamed protein product [Didymodactylos carnosus]|uniref:Uncharacterized protein n=1 Tax=Didymodactylos carnosus TaxID=1234261 RepID=A0A813S7Z8_9BILA|nr:unnamed protein product [Didymodactylos carnosus]CAF1134696.1 unnamed protein product [Didymodactylos carnosus]CAF3575629.1 unnamed protein product [Didymodactylos carnosus]CAF3921998.1 unnamed protein product [Didymodactylos carnosus]